MDTAERKPAQHMHRATSETSPQRVASKSIAAAVLKEKDMTCTKGVW
jgi:hypothetical protein